MEVIVREINDAYESIEKGKEQGFDASVFAEEHIHSALSLVSNKGVVDGIKGLHASIKSAIAQKDIKNSLFSILEGSDVSDQDLIVNQDKLIELANAINESIDNQESFGFIVQFGVPGNQQKDTVKIVASMMDLPYVVLHREDVITTFSKECEPRVNAVFEECKALHSKQQKPVILFIEDLDGIITNIHASPSEGLKRKTVESALCKNLASLQPSDAVIVIVNTEAPFALHNALQDLQRHRIFYHSPTAEQRAACIQRLLSSYDNCLSEYTVRRLLAHSVAFSVRQLRTLFAHAYLLMLVCKYHAIPAEAVSPADVSKQQCFDAVAQFLAERAAGGCPVVPSIPDAVLLALLDKEKPSYSVVDVTRISDWCRALSRPEAEMAELEGMIKTLRERDETIRREDRANTASTEPVERRKGEAYVMKELPTAAMEAAVEKEEMPRAGGLMSPKFSRMMEAEALNTSSGSDYKREMEKNAREEAERVKQNEKKNLEERERMRQEEERRQHSEEERRKAEYEAQKRKEEERQRKIEEKLAAQEAERNRKIEEQRRIREEAARRRQEELERREEERRRKEQEELEQREREREALAEKRRQRMQEEIAKKERQNQKEAAEQMKRFEEERRRIYEVSMGFDAGKYKASTAQLDEQKSAEQKAREADQKKREEAVKKAREQMLEKLQREKEQKEMEKRTYQRLAELRRPAPATNEEKKQRIEAMRETVEKNRDRLKALLALKDEVKEIVAIRRKREEEERKKKEEEERKKKEEEERKRKEEEELERKKREAEEAAARKKKEEEAERRRIEAEKRKQELEKEKEEMRKKKAEKAKKMEERLLQDELMLLDCREKVILLKKMVKEIKAGKW
ncbi:hypothetical protein WA577_004828, partial [Blastocystis sp. JDR]